MRPHRLRFAGIGPYPEPVEIDFDELGTLGLYLIVGPTGAGKTTIFDALTFALYGEVAGSRQKAIKGFVSDHAFSGEPYVELEFSHKGSRWRARRRPPSDDRGARTNDHRLVEIADDGSEGEAVTGTRDVTQRVQELLGLEVEQFKRVVLIPQNEFQDFLIAKDQDKEEILRALFDTALYRRVAERMQDVGRELKAEADALEQELAVREGVARSAVDKLIEDGLLIALAPEAPPLTAAAALEQVAALATAADAERTAADGRNRDAATRLATAAGEAARFDAAAELAAARAQAAAEAGPDSAAAGELALHERAAQVAGPAHAAREAAARATGLAGIATAARSALAELVGQRARPLASLAELVALPADAGPEELRSVLERLAGALAGAARLYADAETDRLAIEEARAAATRADQDAAAADQAIGALDGEIGAHQAESARLLAVAGGLLDAQRAVEALERALEAAAVAPAREAHAEAHERHVVAAEKLAAVDDRLAEARAAIDAEHAGRLAATLADGEPCPVCGALDHPHPAPRSPAAAAVDGVEAERKAAADAETAARQAAATAAQRLAQARAAEAALPAAADQAAVREALAAARTAQDALQGRSEALSALSARRDAATTARSQATTAAATARAAIETTEPLRARRLEQAALVVAQPELEPALAVLAATREAVESLAAAAADLGHAEAAAREAQAALDAVLGATGFASPDAAASALLPPAELATRRARVDAATERARRIEQLIGAAGDPAAVPATRPDLEALRSAATAAGQAQRDAVRRSEALGLARRTLAEVAGELAEKSPVAEESRRHAGKAVELAWLFKNGSSSALPLERWVLRAFFEEVCAVATLRLEQLSRGRYRLALDDKAAGKKGLAIVVFDAHTGKARPVELLSGGEKFLASLALALGLADVVQSQSGGIDLSTMFIDEGFGSLDQETLDVAIDVLRGLLDSGRTVGVITHVEAMKQELPVGLEVVRSGATGGGSLVRAGAALTAAAS